ncbi:hypothetical protein DDB_G0275135 [Dictyostelium discoideum AX4]|uniref:Uncharacterized protein n=1 Tax=Dictyostelium discoideum TaxID=44689 RepID=Q8T2Q9_DICDI|nr:hypothetical protein DDB_G0275135 [Dictyostelium discoideum AX4]EAL69848.1 hypothetical protein DDB_G0275135 [Dictyostelium discoideum AX4]|eukprot:XP_643716.1 hypothetical protein DDB_G0275135 [Dictyostelium discoideum AX4]
MLFKSLNQLFSSSSSSSSSNKIVQVSINSNELSNLFEMNNTVGTNKHYNNAVFTRPQMYSF